MSHTHTRSLLAACATLGILLTFLATDARSAMTKAQIPEFQLQIWVGHWHTKGESGGTPWHADTQCSWSPSHAFVVCDQLINDHVNQLMILGYDRSAKHFESPPSAKTARR